jgi:hypothetical protein
MQLNIEDQWLYQNTLVELPWVQVSLLSCFLSQLETFFFLLNYCKDIHFFNIF